MILRIIMIYLQSVKIMLTSENRTLLSTGELDLSMLEPEHNLEEQSAKVAAS